MTITKKIVIALSDYLQKIIATKKGRSETRLVSSSDIHANK